MLSGAGPAGEALAILATFSDGPWLVLEAPLWGDELEG